MVRISNDVLKLQLKRMLEDESEGIAAYKLLYETTGRKQFLSIAKDEKKHYRMLSNMLKNLR